MNEYYRQQPGQFGQFGQQPGQQFPMPQQQQLYHFPGYGNVDTRLDRLERNMERMERQIQQLDRRVSRIEQRLGNY